MVEVIIWIAAGRQAVGIHKLTGNLGEKMIVLLGCWSVHFGEEFTTLMIIIPSFVRYRNMCT